jgi:hypothetical protein
MTRSIAHCITVLGLTGLLAQSVAAEPQAAPFEYKLKAVFLLNFAKFVQWPADAFASGSAPLTICVIGEDPFGAALDQVVQKETVQGHPLTVARPTAERNYRSCHIAFFSESTEAQYSNIISNHIGASTLTVGENELFSQRGGMIHFMHVGQKMRFVINNDALTNATFELSSKLLSLGRPQGSD